MIEFDDKMKQRQIMAETVISNKKSNRGLQGPKERIKKFS